MSFQKIQKTPSNPRLHSLDDIRTSIGDAMGIMFNPIDSTAETITALSGSYQTWMGDDLIPVEEANTQIQGLDINVDEPISQKELSNLITQKETDLLNQKKLSNLEDSATNNALLMTAGLAGSLLNPIEVVVGVGAAFIPGIGHSYLASRVARHANKTSRTMERVKFGAVEGLAVGTIYEPINYQVQNYYGRDYTAGDAFAGIVTNAVFGSALRAVGGKWVDRKGVAQTYEGRVWNELNPKSKAEIRMVVTERVLADQPITPKDFENLVKSDRFYRLAQSDNFNDFNARVHESFKSKIMENDKALKAYHDDQLRSNHLSSLIEDRSLINKILGGDEVDLDTPEIKQLFKKYKTKDKQELNNAHHKQVNALPKPSLFSYKLETGDLNSSVDIPVKLRRSFGSVLKEEHIKDGSEIIENIKNSKVDSDDVVVPIDTTKDVDGDVDATYEYAVGNMEVNEKADISGISKEIKQIKTVEKTHQDIFDEMLKTCKM